MPANLTPQYIEAEEKYKKAQTPEEKLVALQEMLRHLPKHKGTEKIQAELKRKIGEQKKLDSSAKKNKKKGVSYHVDNNGNPQVVLVGPPNSGKSKLICTLTGADLKVADYPYTTILPQPAMMQYENIQIQLVDTPPVSNIRMDPWLPGIVRCGDAVLFVVDLTSNDILEEMPAVLEGLASQRVYLYEDDAREYQAGDTIQKTLLVTNKIDIPGSLDVLELLQDEYKTRFPFFPVSALTGEGLEALRLKIFEMLEIIRVYPKPPGLKKPNMDAPIILPKGSTVWDLADSIHHEISEKLKSARIWNSKEYASGQRVPRDYEIHDGEIIELET